MVPGFANLVRMTGLEPVRAFTHKHLKLASLPIPAHPQISTNYYSLVYQICQLFFLLSPLKKLFGFSRRKVLTSGGSRGIVSLAPNEERNSSTPSWCTSGGIGRLAGFRCQCSQGRAGSTPASCTTKRTRWCVSSFHFYIRLLPFNLIQSFSEFFFFPSWRIVFNLLS